VIELDEALSDISVLLARLLGETIKLEVSQAATSADQGGPKQLEQVIVNLAVNARDAMPMAARSRIRTANVPTRKPEVPRAGFQAGRIRSARGRRHRKGMPAEVMEKIFEPFFTTKDVARHRPRPLHVYGIVKQTVASSTSIRSRARGRPSASCCRARAAAGGAVEPAEKRAPAPPI